MNAQRAYAFHVNKKNLSLINMTMHQMLTALGYQIGQSSSNVFGVQFAWVTDCYTIKFILSYEGSNSAILCLQMHLMCWDCNIIHRPGSTMVDADYWSQLGMDINFDPCIISISI